MDNTNIVRNITNSYDDIVDNYCNALTRYKSELEDAIASNNQTEIFNKAVRLGGLLTALKEIA